MDRSGRGGGEPSVRSRPNLARLRALPSSAPAQGPHHPLSCSEGRGGRHPCCRQKAMDGNPEMSLFYCEMCFFFFFFLVKH